MAGEETQIWCDRPRWRGVRVSVELLGVVFGVVGVIFLAAQLMQMSKLSRIDKALEFVARYNGTSLLEDRARLRAVAEEVNAGLRAANAASGLNDEQMRVVVGAYFNTAAAPARANLDGLLSVVRFFDEAYICVRSGLCEEDVICQFFTGPAATLHEDFRFAYLDYAEANALPDLGKGVERLSRLTCPNYFAD